MEFTRQNISGNISLKARRAPEDVLKEVAKDFHVGQRRIQASVKRPGARNKMACAARDELCRRLHALGYSTTEIGRFLRGRDSSTVVVAIQRAKKRLADT